MKNLFVRNIALGVFTVLCLASCSGEGPLTRLTDLSLEDLGLGNFSYSEDLTGFYDHLANEYKNLASFEEEYLHDQQHADYFTAKARRALRRQEVKPDDPAEREIPDFALEELRDAREILLDALMNLNIGENGSLLAMAQTRYDCWLAHQEDFPQKDMKTACKPGFYDALALLSLPEADQKIYSIYFDSGATALNKEARETLARFSKRYINRPHWDVVLKGYTDSKGNRYKNKTLAMRRAIAVKNMLGQHGIDLNNIAISAEGEISSDEGKEEDRHSRRVDIKARPHYVAQNKNDLTVTSGWRHSLGY